ncbi:hypothetical protein C5615_37015 [Burkholderia cepacia]|uniref:Uncharacterized protein n=1 Tax=Burkholderia cepacia TaxID=292 RepID=A0A2S8HZZ1_BURCE|nr:hypothetical protein C5615_37015 [Burkholderia cepacia]
MPAGKIQPVIVCDPVSTAYGFNAVDEALCPSSNGRFYRATQQQAYLISPDSAGYIDSVTQPFDYAQAGGFWGFAFTTVLALWLVARSAGAVISIVRRGF